MNAEVQWTCSELISALIEGGAQGALITGLIWGAMKVRPRTNAATRHAAWFVTLLVVALLPVAHFGAAVMEHWKPSPVQSELNVPVEERVPSGIEEAFESNVAEPIVEANAEPASVPEVIHAGAGSLETEVRDRKSPWRLELPMKVAIGLVAAWLILAAIRLGRLAGQLWVLRGIKTSAVRATDSFVYAFARAVAGMGISRRPRLLISENATAPMVVGFFRPAMLLPKSVVERSTGGQLEHLFRHELAHLARWDDWTNLLQQAIAAVLFFHPGVLFLSRRLTAEREIACDDHALAAGRAPREYALFLTEFASQMKGREYSAAPAAWSSNSQLKERIGMILNGKRNASPRVSRAGVGVISAAAITLAVAGLAFTPRLVVAAEDAPKTPAPPEAPVAASAAPVAPLVLVAPAPPSAGVVSITSIEPSGLTIASVTSSSAREKLDISPDVHVSVSPNPVRVTTPRIAQAEPPEPRGRKRVDRGDDDIERRLDRLEKMVEELAHERRKSSAGPDRPGGDLNFNFKPKLDGQPKPALPPDLEMQIHEQIEQAHRDVERAKRDAERSMREQRMAMDQRMSADRQREWDLKQKLELDHKQSAEHNQNWNLQILENANRDSLKARRHALEAQRKQIEKELETLNKEMEKQDEAKRAEKDRDKQNKSEEKLEKKTRDKGNDNSDDAKRQ